MIQPDELHRKAENLYPLYIQAWLDGEEGFFPRVVPAGKTLDADDPSAAIQSVRRLREESKEIVGWGYSVQWREVNSQNSERTSSRAASYLRPQTIYCDLRAKNESFAFSQMQ